MGLRIARAYSFKYARPYTRKSKVQKKSYIKTIPNTKTVKLNMGDITGFNSGKYDTTMTVFSKDNVQVRDNAIEAVRQYLHRFLTELVGKDFYFALKVYPHHILREHALGGVAGADRLSTGMANSFGKNIGRAAIVKANHPLFVVGVSGTKHEQIARDLINSSKSRLPCSIRVETVYTKKK